MVTESLRVFNNVSHQQQAKQYATNEVICIRLFGIYYLVEKTKTKAKTKKFKQQHTTLTKLFAHKCYRLAWYHKACICTHIHVYTLFRTFTQSLTILNNSSRDIAKRTNYKEKKETADEGNVALINQQFLRSQSFITLVYYAISVSVLCAYVCVCMYVCMMCVCVCVSAC